MRKAPIRGPFRCFFEMIGRWAILGALNLPGLHAAGANASLAHMAVLVLDGDLLHIGPEDPVRDPMGVAHVVPE